MKVALLTIHNTQNFGSMLQTYSLYQALKALGADVEILDYKNKKIEERECPVTMRPIKSVRDIGKRIIWGKAQQEKYEYIRGFLQQNAKLSRTYNQSNIREANNAYDLFIAGSDIIWGTNITGGDMTYFLDFVDETKCKLAFSSSAGTEWTENEKKRVKVLLERFDAIAVREQLAAEWVNELISKEPWVTCDPTMLWEPDEWKKYVLDDYANKEKYVLIYAADSDNRNIMDGIQYAKSHGLKAWFINFYSPFIGTKTIHPVTVQQWITLFAHAESIFSASYHGLLFALYFQKPVFFYNRGEKSRMISLSKELCIEHREGLKDNVRKNKGIDYNFVFKKLDEKRDYSWNILKKELAIYGEKVNEVEYNPIIQKKK